MITFVTVSRNKFRGDGDLLDILKYLLNFQMT